MRNRDDDDDADDNSNNSDDVNDYADDKEMRHDIDTAISISHQHSMWEHQE